SVIVPVYNTDHHFLNCCIRSVLYQAYPHWELCLVDDCSTDEELPQLLAQWSTRDARIKVAFHERNTGISGATMTGIDLAGGEYLGFLDHDDELSLDCLFQVAKRINETRAELYYTDEDLVGDDGSRQGVFHKPDYNRELLFSHNYITHFVVIKRELYDKIGGMTAEFDGAQDYNLVLRATEQTDQVIHIPEVLYHWRTAPSSTSIKHEEKPYAHEAGKRALTMSLARRAISAQVHDNHLNFHYRVAYSRTIEPSIAVLVCHHEEDGVSRSKAALLSEKAGYDNLELILLPQESAEKTRSQPERKTILLHRAIETCRSEYVVILDSMPVDISDLWLHHLAAPLFQDSNLGIVCGRVSFAGEDGQSYAVPNLNDRSERYFAAALPAMSRHLNGLHNPQLVRCCDWSLCLFPRAVYREAGGFDLQKFPYLLAMHDFSLTVFESGKKILYTPSATVDFGKQTQPGRVGGLSAITGEKELFQRKWRAVLSEPDPFYNTGILREQQIAYHRFQQWLTGEECLDETGKIH
ncbi:MAG: glycosyltransferase, partial [Desulfofustis sp.]|nr:glycosyltransferase [Desulfofustis sp.]